jgi:chromate transporter
VGVVLNLAVWFGWHILFPREGRFSVFSAVVAIVSLLALIRFNLGVLAIVGFGLACGLGRYLLGLF